MVECGLGDERVLDMPYLRAMALNEYFKGKAKRAKDEYNESKREKTFGMG